VALSSAEISFLKLNTSAIADTLSLNTAKFLNRTLATPPANFPPLRVRDFHVYLNNRRIPDGMVIAIVQNGSDIDVTVNISAYLNIPGAILEDEDEVLLVGKFN